MTKHGTILTAGKQLAAMLGGRALKVKPEDLLKDATLERQGKPTSELETTLETPAIRLAAKESHTEPGNPNEFDHREQMPEQL